MNKEELDIFYNRSEKFLKNHDKCLVPWRSSQILANGDLTISTRCFNMKLGNINESVKNLDMAIAGENFEVEEMYPVYNNAASFQNEKGAVRSTHYAWETEKVHEKMYKEAKEAAQKGKDIDVEKIFICPVCGYTIEGELPNYCPVCNTKKELFKPF